MPSWDHEDLKNKAAQPDAPLHPVGSDKWLLGLLWRRMARLRGILAQLQADMSHTAHTKTIADALATALSELEGVRVLAGDLLEGMDDQR